MPVRTARAACSGRGRPLAWPVEKPDVCRRTVRGNSVRRSWTRLMNTRWLGSSADWRRIKARRALANDLLVGNPVNDDQVLMQQRCQAVYCPLRPNTWTERESMLCGFFWPQAGGLA